MAAVGSMPIDDPAARRGRRRLGLPWGRLLVGSAVASALLAHLAPDERRAAPRLPPRAVLTAPLPAWQVIDSAPAFRLAAGPPLPLPRHEARRHGGGVREDAFSFGRFGDPLAARLALALSPGPPEERGSLFVELARQTGETGLAVLRLARAEAIATKFGPVETAEARLSSGAAERDCLAFRHGDPGHGLRIAGWLCGPETMTAQRAAVTCLLDGLGPSAALEDTPLARLFVEIEPRRAPHCAPAREPAPSRRRERGVSRP